MAIEMRHEDGIPVVFGGFTRDGRFAVICPLCNERHFHGREGIGTEPQASGHRSADCWPAREGTSAGYYVIESEGQV